MAERRGVARVSSDFILGLPRRLTRRHVERCTRPRRRGNRQPARRSTGPERLEARQVLAGNLVISEFMASNDTGLRDEDQNRSDWIEVLNTSDADVNLDGWFLTDDADDLDRWQFPAVNLKPDQRLVVFASGKHRQQADRELHTNFRLAADGGYLALVQPDGLTVEFDFGPSYPTQIPDVSFGLPQPVTFGVPLVTDTPRTLLVPSTENGGDILGTTWTAPEFDDAGWTHDVGRIGYERVDVRYRAVRRLHRHRRGAGNVWREPYSLPAYAVLSCAAGESIPVDSECAVRRWIRCLYQRPGGGETQCAGVANVGFRRDRIS